MLKALCAKKAKNHFLLLISVAVNCKWAQCPLN